MDRAQVMVKVERSGDSGNLTADHGEAPYQVVDLMGWLDTMRAAMGIIVGELCCVAFNSIDEGYAVISAIKGALKEPVDLCNDGIRALKESYPDEEEFKRFHYEGEKEEAAVSEAEAVKRLHAELDELLKGGPIGTISLATSYKETVLALIEGMRKHSIDPETIFQEALTGGRETVTA